jgi:hypothetical protein
MPVLRPRQLPEFQTQVSRRGNDRLLQHALDAIARAEGSVVRQRRLVALLERAGSPTVEAQKQLEELNLDLLEARNHYDILLNLLMPSRVEK